MKVRIIIANYYDSKKERDREEIKVKDNGLTILYKTELEGENVFEYGFTYEIIYISDNISFRISKHYVIITH